MTEVFTEDSNAEEREPSEALDDGLVDFGADLDGDTQDEATPEASGNSEETPSSEQTKKPETPFDPDKVDWLRVDINTIPEQYKPLQQMAKNIQASYTREQQVARQIQEQAQSERQQYLQALQQLQQTYQQQTAQPEQTPYDQVAQYLDEDERRGLEVVQTLNQQAMAPILEQVQALQAQLQEARQGQNAFQQYLQQQQIEKRTAEVSETRAAYGDEVDNLSQPQMLAMKALVDQGATVKGAFESVTGKTSEQIVAARERDKQVRSNAKHSAASTASRATAEGAKVSSDAEVLSEMKKLGFG